MHLVDQTEFLLPVWKSDHLFSHLNSLPSGPQLNLLHTQSAPSSGFTSSCLTHTLLPTVSEHRNHLISSILQAGLLYAPRIRVKHPCINALPRPIRRLQDMRRSLCANYRHTQLECDGVVFRKVCNKCRFEIRKYMAQSQLRTLQISRDNPKYLYKCMRR